MRAQLAVLIAGASRAAPARATTIDGRGKFLMPGIAEFHAHVPSGPQAVNAHRALTLYALAGVTTARGMLGAPMHLALRDSIARGQLFGPRLLTSGPSFNNNSVTSPAVAIAMVNDQKAAGYDLLKIHSLPRWTRGQTRRTLLLRQVPRETSAYAAVKILACDENRLTSGHQPCVFGVVPLGSRVILDKPRAQMNIELDQRSVADAREPVHLASLDDQDIAGTCLELLAIHRPQTLPFLDELNLVVRMEVGLRARSRQPMKEED